MTLYIPPHLRKIGILGKMCQVIEAYGEQYQEKPGSFDDYQLYLKIDPVKRFIGMCLSSTPEIINYLTRCFYELSGTTRVLDLLVEGYLSPILLLDYKYTVDRLYLHFSELTSSFDEGLFYDNLREFLDALLYFGDLKIDIDGLTLNLEGTINSALSPGIKCYGYYKITETL